MVAIFLACPDVCCDFLSALKENHSWEIRLTAHCTIEAETTSGHSRLEDENVHDISEQKLYRFVDYYLSLLVV